MWRKSLKKVDWPRPSGKRKDTPALSRLAMSATSCSVATGTSRSFAFKPGKEYASRSARTLAALARRIACIVRMEVRCEDGECAWRVDGRVSILPLWVKIIATVGPATVGQNRLQPTGGRADRRLLQRARRRGVSAACSDFNAHALDQLRGRPALGSAHAI